MAVTRPVVAGTVTALLALSSCASGEVNPVELSQQWVDQVPAPSAGAYREPTPVEAAALSLAAGAAVTGDVETARAAATTVGYEVAVTRQADMAGDDGELVLLEPGSDALKAGWGRLALRTRAQSPLIVQVPHPVSDVDTGLVAGKLFARTGARALVVAGAHRRAASAADVATSAGSAVQAWQEVLVSEDDVVVQVHGFDAGSHPARYGGAVVSDGAERDDGSRPGRASLLVAEALEAEGIEVCLHHRDRCDRLAGTGNVQGVAARTAGAQFVHLELARPLRSSPEGRDRVVAALARVLSATP